MQYAESRRAKSSMPWAVRTGRVGALAILTGMLVGLSGGIGAASAGTSGFPRAYSPETAAGFTNTFTPPTNGLNPDCPNGIAGTPGSDPASLSLNSVLDTSASSLVGGTVHFVYADNPHGSAFGFTIQVCAVVYPPSFFNSSDFNPTTGVLVSGGFSKHALDANGTAIDGASLSGISNAQGDIYFTWTIPTVAPGSWVCSFARDIDSNHGGGGNRKVTPACLEVSSPVVQV
jgi:hypothetical protein